MRTSEVLNLAADLIEQRGWITGAGWPGTPAYETDGGKLCLEGGIMAALGMEYDTSRHDGALDGLHSCPAYKAVADYLRRDQGWKGDLWLWNDTRSRTAEEVTDLLRTVATQEAQKEEELA